MEERKESLKELSDLAGTPLKEGERYSNRIERMQYLNSTDSYCPDAD